VEDLLDLVRGKAGAVRGGRSPGRRRENLTDFGLPVTHLAMLQALALRLAQHVRHVCAGAI